MRGFRQIVIIMRTCPEHILEGLKLCAEECRIMDDLK